MEKINRIDKTKSNFEKLEDKLRIVISQCNNRNKVNTITESDSYSPKYHRLHSNVQNASVIEHYQLDNGLNVYKFINDEQYPIDYWIFPRPIMKKYLTEDNINDVRFVTSSGFEYSVGGIKNSVVIDTNQAFSSEKFISTIDLDNSKAYSELHATNGYHLSYDEFSTKSRNARIVQPFNYDLRPFIDNGDLEGYISSFQPETTEQTNIKKDLEDTLTKINSFAISSHPKDTSSKKGLLKKLLNTNKDLDMQIDAFAKSTKRGK